MPRYQTDDDLLKRWMKNGLNRLRRYCLKCPESHSQWHLGQRGKSLSLSLVVKYKLIYWHSDIYSNRAPARRIARRRKFSFLLAELSKKMHPVYLPFQFAKFYDAINGLQGIVHFCRFGGDCVLSVLGRLFAFTVTLLIAKSIDWLTQWQSREVKGV